MESGEQLLRAGFDCERSWDLQVLPASGYSLAEGARYTGAASPGVGSITRHVPLWASGPGLPAGSDRTHSSAAQVGPTLAAWLGLDPMPDATAVALAAASPSAAPDAPGRAPLKLTLLHTNDHHGQDRDRAGSADRPGSGGMAMRAALVHSIRRERQGPRERVLLVDAGDVSTGPCEATALSGRASFEAMDLMGYDALVVGNHEFDVPVPTLLGELDRLGFPALAANVTYAPRPCRWLRPFRTVVVGDYRVALVGLAPPDTPRLSAHGHAPGLRFGDWATLGPLVRKLRSEVDLLVVLSHQGLQADLQLAEALEGIDVIVGGHTETATKEAMRVGATVVVQTGYDGRNVGQADLELSDGGVRLISYELLPVPDSATGSWPPDPAIAALVERRWRSVAQRCAANIGRLKFSFDRKPLAGAGTGSTLLHLVTDAMLWRSEAHVALQNLGGVRADLPAGQITVGHLKSALPFGNTIRTLTMGGAQIQALLGEIAARDPGSKGVLYASGLTWELRQGQPADVRIGGQPLAPGRRYRVATNAFLARGGDKYKGLAAAGPGRDTGVTLVDALADYLRGRASIKPDNSPRIRRVP